MREVDAIQADVLRLAARTARLRADHLDLLAELNRDHLPHGDRLKDAPLLKYLAGQLDSLESDLLRKVERDLLEAAETRSVSFAEER